MYLISKYNLYIVVKGKYYIYNTISNKYLEFSEAVFTALHHADICSEQINTDYVSPLPAGIQQDDIHKLFSSNMIYHSFADENELLKSLNAKHKFDTSFSSLIVLPVLNCNLNCHYCYEKDKNELITDEKESIFKRFLLSEIRKKDNLNIRWSGGEPLLVWNRIKRISEFIIENCEQNKCNYSASIITNGTLLSEQRTQELVQCGIKSAQITLDGNSTHHDRIRKFKINGLGTFDTILRNISVASREIKIHLRINVDKDNIGTMASLFDEISATSINRRNVQLFCRPVMCSLARTPNSKLYSQSEFFEIEKMLLQLAKDRNLQYCFHRGMGNKAIRCCMNSIEGFYISPSLLLYKCPMFIDSDKSHAVGYIDNNGNIKITNPSEFKKGFNITPFNGNSKCMFCKVLPICNGECAMQKLFSPDDPMAGCIPDKYSIKDKIVYAIENSLENDALNRSSFLN